MRMLWTAIGVLTLLFSPSLLAQWQGRSINAVMARYGTPDVKIVLKSGHTRYIYNFLYEDRSISERPRYSTKIVGVGPKGQAIGAYLPSGANPPETYSLTKCTIIFDVNKQNIVVSESRQGNC